MKVDRTKNARNGVLFGTILNVYKLLAKFLMRTAIIYFLKMEYVGLDGLFISILNVLNLAELGVGGAMVYSMYKPISKNDTETMCALLNLYKKYYRIIGCIILVLGVSISPLIPKLIGSDVPDNINIYILYYINLAVTISSYWLFAYKSSLLAAHQRNDIISKVTILVYTIQYALQLLVLYIFKNYYYYLIVSLISQILINILCAYKSKKEYPNYIAKGVIDSKIKKEINGKVKDLFISRVGGVILTSADSIVISAFLGLTSLAIYQNYFYIVSALIAFTGIIFTSSLAGIGNSLITESKEKNYNDFKVFAFINLWIATFCTACFINSAQDFMSIWVGTQYLLPFQIVICLASYFYFLEMTTIFTTYKDAAGIWHTDRLRTIITAGLNLILNLITVRFIGLYGVVLSTVISLVLVGIPWLTKNLFKELFSDDIKKFVYRMVMYVFSTIIIIASSLLICNLISTNSYILNIIIKISISSILSIVLWHLMYFRTNEYKKSKLILKRIFKR